MRYKVAGREVVVWGGRVPVRRRHDKRYIFTDELLVRNVCIILLHPNGRLDRTGQGRVLHHFAELVDIVCTVVTMFFPDVQKVIESTVMLGILLSIVGCRVTQQFDDIRLTRAGQSRKSRRGV